MKLTMVPQGELPAPPYPAEVRARGWNFMLDYERIEQSDTWALTPPEARPWLLMLWLTAWKQAPCGTMPADDALVAAKIGMPARDFAAWRDVLMRGWVRHSDGLMYHPTITHQVLGMMGKRRSEADRVALWRANRSVECNALLTRNQHVSTTPVPEPVPSKTLNHAVPDGTVVIGGPDDPPSESSKVPRCPAEQIIDLYHGTLPTLPRCKVLTDTRQRAIRARWRAWAAMDGWETPEDGLEAFGEFFRRVSTSPFLMGKVAGRDGRPPFQASLDWLMSPTNWVKVYEGAYEKRSKA